MIVTYLRSSSVSCWEFCPFKYFLSYNLSIKEPANKKAIIGNVVHKALEIMAKQKLAIQNGQNEIFEDETETKFKTTDDDKVALAAAYKYYSELETHIDWSYPDYLRCRELLNKALTFNDGEYNPMKNNIVSPEMKFDIEIKKDWSYFNYGNGNKGYLRVKGTIDLIVKNECDDSYHIYDWKTGKRYDWAKDKDKTFNDLGQDFQLILYFFAVKTLFPDKNLYLTIYYIDFDEPVTLMFDEDTMIKAEEMIKKWFLEIKNSSKPKKKISWKCTKLCHYGRFSLDGKKVPDYKGSMCDSLSNELTQIGIDKMFSLRSLDKDFKNYTGGGRSKNNDIPEKPS